jgi:hypothetical protein
MAKASNRRRDLSDGDDSEHRLITDVAERHLHPSMDGVVWQPEGLGYVGLEDEAKVGDLAKVVTHRSADVGAELPVRNPINQSVEG